jgi:hypothetical protein
VKIWFQNRRMKWRNSKERELLASGGSRQQTLPTKSNPHPDLSDSEVERQAKRSLLAAQHHPQQVASSTSCSSSVSSSSASSVIVVVDEEMNATCCATHGENH